MGNTTSREARRSRSAGRDGGSRHRSSSWQQSREYEFEPELSNKRVTFAASQQSLARTTSVDNLSRSKRRVRGDHRTSTPSLFNMTGRQTPDVRGPRVSSNPMPESRHVHHAKGRAPPPPQSYPHNQNTLPSHHFRQAPSDYPDHTSETGSNLSSASRHDRLVPLEERDRHRHNRHRDHPRRQEKERGYGADHRSHDQHHEHHQHQNQHQNQHQLQQHQSRDHHHHPPTPSSPVGLRRKSFFDSQSSLASNISYTAGGDNCPHCRAVFTSSVVPPPPILDTRRTEKQPLPYITNLLEANSHVYENRDHVVSGPQFNVGQFRTLPSRSRQQDQPPPQQQDQPPPRPQRKQAPRPSSAAQTDSPVELRVQPMNAFHAKIPLPGEAAGSLIEPHNTTPQPRLTTPQPRLTAPQPRISRHTSPDPEIYDTVLPDTDSVLSPVRSESRVNLNRSVSALERPSASKVQYSKVRGKSPRNSGSGMSVLSLFRSSSTQEKADSWYITRLKGAGNELTLVRESELRALRKKGRVAEAERAPALLVSAYRANLGLNNKTPLGADEAQYDSGISPGSSNRTSSSTQRHDRQQRMTLVQEYLAQVGQEQMSHEIA